MIDEWISFATTSLLVEDDVFYDISGIRASPVKTTTTCEEYIIDFAQVQSRVENTFCHSLFKLI